MKEKKNSWKSLKTSASFPNKTSILYRVFLQDIMAAILVFQNNETVAMLVY